MNHTNSTIKRHAPRGARLRATIAASLGSASIAVGVAITPAPANAAVCSAICASTLAAVTQGTATVLGAIAATQTAIVTAITTSTQMIIMAIKSNAESVVGANEKAINANKELSQAQMNYDAAAETTRNYAEAAEMYTAPGAQAFKVCETVAQGQQTSSVATESNVSAKAMTAVHVDRSLNSDSGAAAKAMLDDYRQNYCSAADKAQGRCDTVAPITRQNGSVRADILMAPLADQTYSPEESRAAAQYITMVTNPVPAQPLPKGFARAPGSDRFQIEQLHSAAQMSVAQHSLEQIKASKEPGGAGSNAAPGYNSVLSLVGLLKKFVDDRFGNTAYAKSVGDMNELGVLKEINQQLAYSNFVDYHAFVQNERVEALLATMLAGATRERAERQLGAARAAMSSR